MLCSNSAACTYVVKGKHRSSLETVNLNPKQHIGNHLWAGIVESNVYRQHAPVEEHHHLLQAQAVLQHAHGWVYVVEGTDVAASPRP